MSQDFAVPTCKSHVHRVAWHRVFFPHAEPHTTHNTQRTTHTRAHAHTRHTCTHTHIPQMHTHTHKTNHATETHTHTHTHTHGPTQTHAYIKTQIGCCCCGCCCCCCCGCCCCSVVESRPARIPLSVRKTAICKTFVDQPPRCPRSQCCWASRLSGNVGVENSHSCGLMSTWTVTTLRSGAEVSWFALPNIQMAVFFADT